MFIKTGDKKWWFNYSLLAAPARPAAAGAGLPAVTRNISQESINTEPRKNGSADPGIINMGVVVKWSFTDILCCWNYKTAFSILGLHEHWDHTTHPSRCMNCKLRFPIVNFPWVGGLALAMTQPIHNMEIAGQRPGHWYISTVTLNSQLSIITSRHSKRLGPENVWKHKTRFVKLGTWCVCRCWDWWHNLPWM